MDEPTRRAWSGPELIVLVRRQPEEAVLTGCKMYKAGASSTNGIFSVCLTKGQCETECQGSAVS